MKKLLVVLPVFLAIISNAQVSTTALDGNSAISEFLNTNPNYQWSPKQHLNKWGTKDTLNLPFFDDFTIHSIYPDSNLWLNNQVYVNNHFPVLPPSLGVATFDGLDQKGVPYNGGTINKNISGPGDSLISQLINLKDSGGVSYQLSDSIYLSFFIQPNGNGYHLRSQDSIRLFFKTKFNSWIQVWSKGGSEGSKPFEQVIIPIKELGYLHEGFQFMFTTYTRMVGNANHWHLDYVYLDKNRSYANPYFDDYAIQTNPTPLLKNYYEMPYSHFLMDPSAESADSVNFRVSSLFNTTYVIEVKHIDRFKGVQLVNTSFASNSVNLLSLSSSRRRFNKYNFYSTLSGPLPIVIDREITMRESGILNKNRINDSIVVQQRMYDYFAYDDGTAEQGFGFDQLTNPSNIEGEIAYKFKLSKADTLYAIGTFFNRAVFDVSRELFKFRVWQSIAEPGTGNSDVLIYESDAMSPLYSNSLNRYSMHYLDTLLELPAGDFYIGWYQSSMYNLNVGWDKNFGGRDDANKASDKLFYKWNGVWSNSNLPSGTLMMRPFVGSSREVFAHVVQQQTLSKALAFYPNPASTLIHFNEELAVVQVYSMDGRLLQIAYDAQSMDISELSNGIYSLVAKTRGNEWLKAKLVIFAN